VDELPLKLDFPLEVVSNLDTTDGITNGADCKLVHMEIDAARNSVISVFVKFDNSRCGKKTKQKYNGIHGIRFKRISKTFRVRTGTANTKKTVTRSQFPFRLAASKTIHRVQGLTWDEYAVELRGCSRIPSHMFYVALSRGRNPRHIYIPGFKRSWIKVDESVVQEMERLRSQRKIQFDHPFSGHVVCNRLTVMTHNCGGFRDEDYVNHPAIQHAHILLLCETKQMRMNHNCSFAAGANQLTCAVHHKGSPHSGIMLFVNPDINVTYSFECVESHVQMVLCGFEFMNASILLIGVYNHHKLGPKTHITLLQTIFNKVSTLLQVDSYNGFIVTGDFNIANKRSPDIQYSAMDVACAQHGLVDMLPLVPTTVHNTCIDYMLASRGLSACKVDGNVYPWELSDGHHLLYSVFDTDCM
jgi:hypothetical protein